MIRIPSTDLNRHVTCGRGFPFRGNTLGAKFPTQIPRRKILPLRPRPIARHSIDSASPVIGVTTPAAGLHLDTLRRRQFRDQRRHVGEAGAQAAQPRDAACRHAAAR